MVNTSHQSNDHEIVGLLSELGHEIETADNLMLGIRKIGESSFNLAVINQTHLDEHSAPPLIKLNRSLPSLPLLVLSQQISIFAYRKIGQLNNFVTLQKPFQDTVFSNLVQKIISEQPIQPSILPRFVTDEPVRILVLGTGLHLTSRMKNYSAGGAFVQYRGISMKVGDRLRVGFPNSGDRSESASLRGHVRWIKEGDGPSSAMRGIGIQFEAA
jgi:hypothetical protein